MNYISSHVLNRHFWIIGILIASFLYDSVGSYLQWHMQWKQTRQNIKHQLKLSISKDDLHSFTLWAYEYKNLDWVKPGKEFRLGKKMFDVVYISIHNNRYLLQCINDREESVLFENLESLVSAELEEQEKDPSKSHKVKKQKKDWQKMQIGIYEPEFFCSYCFVPVSRNYTEPWPIPDSPPPRSENKI